MGDRTAIEQLYAEALSRADWLPPLARLRCRFAEVSQDEIVHIIKVGAGEIGGFVSVYRPDAFIHHLFIDPRFQRQGLASSLLHSLRAWLPLPWRLKCVRANVDALAFYASYGWREVGEGDGEDGHYSVLQFDRASDRSIERPSSS